MPQLQVSSDYMPDSLTGHLSSVRVVISVMLKGFKGFIIKGLISLQFLFTAFHDVATSLPPHWQSRFASMWHNLLVTKPKLIGGASFVIFLPLKIENLMCNFIPFNVMCSQSHPFSSTIWRTYSSCVDLSGIVSCLVASGTPALFNVFVRTITRMWTFQDLRTLGRSCCWTTSSLISFREHSIKYF